MTHTTALFAVHKPCGHLNAISVIWRLRAWCLTPPYAVSREHGGRWKGIPAGGPGLAQLRRQLSRLAPTTTRSNGGQRSGRAGRVTVFKSVTHNRLPWDHDSKLGSNLISTT